jgi:hypothetical protein
LKVENVSICKLVLDSLMPCLLKMQCIHHMARPLATVQFSPNR